MDQSPWRHCDCVFRHMTGGCAPGLEQKRHVGKIRGSDVHHCSGSCGGLGAEGADRLSVVEVNGGTEQARIDYVNNQKRKPQGAQQSHRASVATRDPVLRNLARLHTHFLTAKKDDKFSID